MRRLRILIVSEFDGGDANVVRDYLFAFNAYSQHDYQYVFDCRHLDTEVDLRAFDVIVLFWSVYLLHGRLAEAVRDRIREAPALKILFLQDEYRDVRAMNAAMARLGIDVMCTCVDEADHETFYPRALVPTLRATYTVLTGYVPAYLERARVDLVSPRPLDVAYRSRAVPFHLGDLGQEKRIVAERFERLGRELGWRVDISVRDEDRLYGRRWVDFLRSARFVLGSASGASVIDFTGEIRRRCEAYLAAHPAAAYEEVKARFFADVDGKVIIDTVSPRIFEAAALGCTLVLHEGRYGGILEPDVHYIRVRRDYGNLGEVLDRMRDSAFARQLAENTQRDLVTSGAYGYRAFGRWFDSMLATHVGARRRVVSRSRIAFYWQAYRRHRARLLPLGAGFLALPDPAADVGHPALRAVLALRLALRDRAMRRLLVCWVMHRSVHRGIGLGALLADCLRLAIARQAQGGELTAWGELFGVAPILDRASRALRLTTWRLDPSRPAPLSASSGGGMTALAAAFRRGDIRTVIWDHRAEGAYVPYGLSRSWWLSVPLGPLGLYRFQPDPATQRYPLTLISPASERTISSTLGELTRPDVKLSMHPLDAEIRGLADGDLVRIFNELGEVHCTLHVIPAIRPGTVSLPKGLWRRSTRNNQTTTALVPDTLTDLGGGACFNDARVQVASLPTA